VTRNKEKAMLKSGILNPAINSLLSRVRHTNMLVIADRGFPYWNDIEIVDISLVDDMPTVLQVLAAIRQNYVIGKIYMAEEFKQVNTDDTQTTFTHAMQDIAVQYESHEMLKKRVPEATGLIRTGDTIQYANMILVSA
jgi:D-ribose pyranase